MFRRILTSLSTRLDEVLTTRLSLLPQLNYERDGLGGAPPPGVRGDEICVDEGKYCDKKLLIPDLKTRIAILVINICQMKTSQYSFPDLTLRLKICKDGASRTYRSP